MVVPHLLDVEVASGIRRLAANATLTDNEAWSMIAVIATLPIDRRDRRGLLPRAFDWRHGVSVHDGCSWHRPS